MIKMRKHPLFLLSAPTDQIQAQGTFFTCHMGTRILIAMRNTEAKELDWTVGTWLTRWFAHSVSKDLKNTNASQKEKGKKIKSRSRSWKYFAAFTFWNNPAPFPENIFKCQKLFQTFKPTTFFLTNALHFRSFRESYLADYLHSGRPATTFDHDRRSVARR